MQNKIVIAIVAILMAASFAGIVCVGDDSDAAVTSPITISTAEGDFVEGNSIVFADGKVSGTLMATDKGEYKFVLVVGDVTGKNVYYSVPCPLVGTTESKVEIPAYNIAKAIDGKIVFEGTM